jgi:hypothetical protein
VCTLQLASPPSPVGFGTCPQHTHWRATLKNLFSLSPLPPVQYLMELLAPVQAIYSSKPEELELFAVFDCALEWLVLGTAIIRGKPKIVALELQLRELRSKITDHSVNMKPLETAVRCLPSPAATVADGVCNLGVYFLLVSCTLVRCGVRVTPFRT